MQFTLDHIQIESPRTPCCSATQATSTMTPALMNAVRRRNSSPALAKKRLLLSDQLHPRNSHQRHTNEENHPKLSETPKPTAPSPPKNETVPFQQRPRGQPAPSTPQRPPPRPLGLTPSSTRSAPARLRFSPSPKTNWSPENVDDKITKELRKDLLQKDLKEGGGIVYLFEVVPADAPGRIIRKIGHTARTQLDREDEIKSKCKHFSIEGDHSRGGALSLFLKAEKLAQAHLVDYKYDDFACACKSKAGTTHTEYFDVDTATAQKVIQFWRTFCEANPYDARGKLRPFWKHRLDHRNNLPHWRESDIEGRDELDCRLWRWGVFANPTQFEIFWFHVTYAVLKTWPWRLHIIAGLEGLVIVFLMAPSLETLSIWLTILAICILWDEGTVLSNYVHIMRKRLLG